MSSLRHRLMTAWVRLRRYPPQMRADMRAGVTNADGVPRKLADRFERFEHEGRPVYVARPRAPTSTLSGAPCVLHFHGGGFVYALNAMHYAAAARLADAAGAEVWLPEYPLPPDRDGDAAGGAAWADGLVDKALADGPLVLSGDSAGGALALGAAQRLAAAGRAGPERLLLLSPWTDLSMTNPALTAADETEPLIGLDVLAAAGRHYAGGRDVRDPLVSPLYGDMTGLPPTAIHAGGRDLLYPDIVRLADAMRAAGVDAALTAHPDLGHYWMFYPVPEARRTWDAVAAWVRGA